MQPVKTFKLPLLLVCIILILPSCKRESEPTVRGPALPANPIRKPLAPNSPPQMKKLIDGAIAQAGVTTGYDPSYVQLDYPGGDVDKTTGVCSDVLIRAFREAGVDLQKEVHEDMKRAWPEYPKKWGLSRPDTNIDHRRVPNLMTYFTRHGESLSITQDPLDYLPGDVVAWSLNSGLDHIGIVTDMWSESTNRFLIAHNIGAGARVEDVLFAWHIKGHYRLFK